MASLIDRVSNVLRQRLADFEPYLETVPGSRRITGFVVSSSFQRKSDEKRHELLWSVLKNGLQKKDLLDVGAIVAMTPKEARLLSDRD